MLHYIDGFPPLSQIKQYLSVVSCFVPLCRITLYITINLYAHSLILNVLNNDDNTITIEGGFSTGEDAAGAMIRLELLSSGEVIFKERLPSQSELTVKIPKEPYQIVLDGGPGHTIIKDGIPPIEGYIEEIKIKTVNSKLSTAENANNEWDLLTILFFILCLILFSLTIYFSNRNTNKILNQLKQ